MMMSGSVTTPNDDEKTEDSAHQSAEQPPNVSMDAMITNVFIFAITVTDYLFLACMLTVQCVHDARHYIQPLTAACVTFDTTLEFSFSCLYSSS